MASSSGTKEIPTEYLAVLQDPESDNEAQERKEQPESYAGHMIAEGGGGSASSPPSQILKLLLPTEKRASGGNAIF